MEEISHDDGIIKVVQIVVRRSVRYTIKQLDVLYFIYPAYILSVLWHFPFLNCLRTSWTSEIVRISEFMFMLLGGKVWGYCSGFITSGWISIGFSFKWSLKKSVNISEEIRLIRSAIGRGPLYGGVRYRSGSAVGRGPL